VLTAGQQARSLLRMRPYLFAEDAEQFPKPYVKWSSEPARSDDVPAAIAQAFLIAMQQAVAIGADVEGVFEHHPESDPPFSLLQWRVR
jgi:thiamine pyrophosphate-dependent acetolactate synthase large subunit-like protein